MKLSKKFVKRVIKEERVDTKNYHYWTVYEIDTDEYVIYRIRQSLYWGGLAHGKPETIVVKA